MLKVSTSIHCVFAESKINIELGEGGSEINLFKMFSKIAKCPNNFGQDCRYNLILRITLFIQNHQRKNYFKHYKRKVQGKEHTHVNTQEAN